MAKTIKLILANAPLQNGNRGCSALTYSAIYLIDKVLKESNRDYEIWLPDAGIKSWSFDGTFSILQQSYFAKPIRYPRYDLRGVVRSAISKTLHAVRRVPSHEDHFKKADFVLNVGQGDSFSDLYGEVRFNAMNRACVCALRNGVPLCFLPQTIGPFKSPQILDLAKSSMLGAIRVMTRDRQSLECVRMCSPQINAREYIDMAFFMPYEEIVQDCGMIHVGLNISALMWNGGYSRNNQFALKCNYQKVIRSVIDYFSLLPDVKVHLVPHVVEPSSNIENDYEVSYNIWREYGNERVILAPFALDPIVAKSYIAGMDFFMGARMHATIAAFSTNVPVVPMAYSRKFTGLYEDTLDYHHVIDMLKCDEDACLGQIKIAFAQKDELKREIAERNVKTVDVRGEALKEDIRNLLSCI